MPTDAGTLPDWVALERLARQQRDRQRSELLQAAGRALQASDRAHVRAIDAFRAGSLETCRAELERSQRLERDAAAAMARFRELETPRA